MNSFIHKVAEYIFRTHGEAVGEVCVVLPNRRAGLFFNRAVATLTSRPVWAPRVMDIRGFIETLADRETTDELLLVKELYDVYKNILGTKESFDQFYPWGVMLLGDFDDLDKYMVGARDLFRNLKAVKELSADSSYLTQEQVELIRRFWDHFPETGGGQATAFLKLWENLYNIYETFRTVLRKKGMAYEGMLYREVAEHIRDGSGEITIPAPLYFVGFNALTPAEEILFKRLQARQQASFFWDYDVAYLARHGEAPLAGHDAGRFIAGYLKKFPPPEDLEIFDNLMSEDKKIEIWASPNRTTQSWVVKQVLERWEKSGVPSDERVALVLADEQLLLPVLHALPPEKGKVNVTMGYPVKESPVYALFAQALTLMKKKHLSESGEPLYYYRDVLALLHNPFVRKKGGKRLQEKEKEILKNNRIYLRAEEIAREAPVSLIFAEQDDIPLYARSLLEVIYEMIVPGDEAEKESPATDLNLEVFYRLSSLVNRFNDFVGEQNLEITAGGYLSFLLFLAEKESVSFYGEPLQGLQVMGLLETRLLDFDRLIVLSVNENNLPAPASSPSFIPYNLRKGFGMPSWEHRDSLYAYYFFRLLQRAREVVLVYHTESEQDMTGEKSRYISQLQYFLGRGRAVNNLFYRPGINQKSVLTVEKDGDIISRMISLYTEDRSLSPSALNTYLDCRLRFYYRYVAGIREPDEISEDVDHALFGRLIHRALEILYDPAAPHLPAGGLITPDVLRRMEQNVLEKAVDTAMDEVLYEGSTHPGKQEIPLNRIIRTMVVRYVQKVLRYDRQWAPLISLGVETEVYDKIPVITGGKTILVKLFGKIDRVDKTEQGVRVIDYKSGGKGSSKLGFENIDELFDPRQPSRKKEIFQVLMYAMMYPAEDPPVPVLYFIKNMFGTEALQQVKKGSRNNKEIYRFDRQEKQYFRERIIGLVEEIFDPAVPFDMTSREDNCKNCPFKEICERE